jgi:hypothetical protein
MMDDFEKESKVYKKALKAALSGLFLSISHHPSSLREAHKKAPSDDRAFSFRL